MLRSIEIKLKEIELFDQKLLQIVGPDSQDYLDWKDALNKISIDPDRKDNF